MKRIMHGIWSGLALAGLAAHALGNPTDSPDNPYQRLVARNVFGLKDATIITPPPPPPAPAVQIKFQGVAKLGGKKQVLLKIIEPPKPGTPPKEQAIIMDEGERRDLLEILAIDTEARSVKLSNSGVVTNLLLTDFIAKTAAPAPGAMLPPMAPGIPQAALPAIPPPVPAPGAGTAMTSVGGRMAVPNLPPRQLRTTPTAGVSVGGGGPGVGVPATGNPHPQSQLTAEQQMILMEVERERTKEAVARGDMPPLPPTPITPAGSAGMSPPPQVPPPRR